LAKKKKRKEKIAIINSVFLVSSKQDFWLISPLHKFIIISLVRKKSPREVGGERDSSCSPFSSQVAVSVN